MLEHVLTALRSHRGEWVSGQALGRELSLTRSAVWKHVSRLRSEGYGIESSPRKGYRLQEEPYRLHAREIQRGLGARVFGRREIFCEAETDSTNTRAVLLASEGAPEGSLVAAESQSRGRGRRGRWWFSPHGEGLYLSLVLRPAIPPARAAGLTLAAGLAAAEALRRTHPALDTHIRWPNDLMIGNRKVGGILTEISGDMDAVDFAVTGLGVNVDCREFPRELEGRATSLSLEGGGPTDRASLARFFLEAYERHWTSFLEGRTCILRDKWKRLSRNLGRSVTVETTAERLAGVAVDISPEGGLMVRDGAGRIHTVLSGDLGFCDESNG